VTLLEVFNPEGRINIKHTSEQVTRRIFGAKRDKIMTVQRELLKCFIICA
jgi:hypothetical protein